MPRILSHIFNFGLFSFWVCSSSGQGQGCVAGLAAGREGTQVGGEGQSPLPSPRVAQGLAEPGRIEGTGAQLGDRGWGSQQMSDHGLSTATGLIKYQMFVLCVSCGHSHLS